jgi:hypothetical protein
MTLYIADIHSNSRNILDMLLCKAVHAYYISGCKVNCIMCLSKELFCIQRSMLYTL